MSERYVAGGYFQYCQWCLHDNDCNLTHNEFLYGASETPVELDENKVNCSGKIIFDNNPFFPLTCENSKECGQRGSVGYLSYPIAQSFGVICKKFKPNETGNQRLQVAKELAREQGVTVSEVVDQLDPPNSHYRYVVGP